MLKIFQRSLTYRQTREVPEFHKGSWIHLEKPSDAELDQATTLLGVELDILQDALDPYEAPRVEVEPEATYTFVRYPQNDTTIPLLVGIAKDGLFSVSQQADNPVMDKFINGNIDFYTTQKARFVLLVIQEIDKQYGRALASIRKEVNRSKTRPDKMSSKEIVKFVSYESTVSDYLDALIPQQAILSKILHGKTFVVHEEDEDLVEDLVLSANQLIEACRALLRTMTNISDTYRAIATDRLNVIIRRLTALTVLLTIPTVITSFYGMNVMLPGSNHPEASYLILAGILTTTGLVFFILSKNRWL